MLMATSEVMWLRHARASSKIFTKRSSRAFSHISIFISQHFCRKSYSYEEKELSENTPNLRDGDRIHYPIFHDETCFHANDQAASLWMRDGEQPLRNKSRGRIVHVSDFILEHCGRLKLTEDELAKSDITVSDARKIIYPGANYDKWWDMPQLIDQVCILLLKISLLTRVSDQRRYQDLRGKVS